MTFNIYIYPFISWVQILHMLETKEKQIQDYANKFAYGYRQVYVHTNTHTLKSYSYSTK